MTTSSFNIGIGFDGSDMALKAVTESTKIFNDPKHTFFVYLIYPVVTGDLPFGYTEEEAKEVNHDAKRLCEECSKLAKQKLEDLGLNFKIVIEGGDPRQIICENAKKHNLDYLFLGTRGLSTLSGLFLGSTSHYCLQNAPCSVVVIK